MTKTEAVKLIEAGAFIVLGEYRMSQSEMLNWRDKTNGKPMSAPILRHTVEVGNRSIAVNERVPDGTKLEEIVVNFKKGDVVALHLDEMTANKGLVSCRGRLEKIVSDRLESPGIAPQVAGGRTSRS